MSSPDSALTYAFTQMIDKVFPPVARYFILQNVIADTSYDGILVPRVREKVSSSIDVSSSRFAIS